MLKCKGSVDKLGYTYVHARLPVCLSVCLSVLASVPVSVGSLPVCHLSFCSSLCFCRSFTSHAAVLISVLLELRPLCVCLSAFGQNKRLFYSRISGLASWLHSDLEDERSAYCINACTDCPWKGAFGKEGRWHAVRWVVVAGAQPDCESTHPLSPLCPLPCLGAPACSLCHPRPWLH